MELNSAVPAGIVAVILSPALGGVSGPEARVAPSLPLASHLQFVAWVSAR